MSLTLTITSYQKSSPGQSTSKVLEQGRITIGRAPENDWVLSDPEMVLSKSHCVIEYQQGGYVITDTSTNGIYINNAEERLGRGNSIEIKHGTTITLGDYEIQASLTGADAQAGYDSSFGLGNFDETTDIFEAGSLGPPGTVGGDDTSLGLGLGAPHNVSESVAYPSEIFSTDGTTDPLGLTESTTEPVWNQPSEYDHLPSEREYFQPPSAQADAAMPPLVEPAEPAAVPAPDSEEGEHGIIPEDWDDSLIGRPLVSEADRVPPATDNPATAGVDTFGFEPVSPKPATPVQSEPPSEPPSEPIQVKPPTPPAPPSAAVAEPLPVEPMSAAPIPVDDERLAVTADAREIGISTERMPLVDLPTEPTPVPVPAPPLQPAPPVSTAPAPVPVRLRQVAPAPAPPKPAAPAAPAARQTPPVQRPVSIPSTRGTEVAALQAFVRGAGLRDLPPGQTDVNALMQSIGQIFRQTAQGMMALLQARKNVKSEFHVEQTMVAPIKNNPLKIMPTVEEAMKVMLSRQDQTWITPEQAIAEGFDDIRAHELAVIAGMQAALSHLLDTFDPQHLEKELGEHSTFASLLPGGRKARYWDAFTTLYSKLAAKAEDDFQELFRKEFARAYEAQQLKLKNRQN